jgi:hypothetical protein
MYNGSITANAVTPSVNMKNRIINGAMVIDQRNNGASVTNTSADLVFPVDRTNIYGTVSSKFTAQQNAGSVTPPVGFTNYLGCTSSSAYTVGASESFWVQQRIEGFNTADLQWGTANAKTVTLSFWVRSSLTGTFGGSFQNSASDRSYPYSYTISSANTWEYKTITVAGDTTGTWIGATNGMGVKIFWGLGSGATVSNTAGAWAAGNFASATGATSVVGTNGATFYITGVQLEVGSTATSFDYRPYGTELALCQRYYYQAIPTNSNNRYTVACVASSATTAKGFFTLPVTMRTQPTLSASSGASYYDFFIAGADYLTNALSIEPPTTNYAQIGATIAGATAGQAGVLYINNNSAAIAFSAEL